MHSAHCTLHSARFNCLKRPGDMTGFSALPFVENSHESQWIGRARILGPPLTRLPTLTIGLLGVQVLWSVEMSYGEWLSTPSLDVIQWCYTSPASPYLLSLGLSKPLMAVVFLAGPLSGLIVQPLIGISVIFCISSFPQPVPRRAS